MQKLENEQIKYQEDCNDFGVIKEIEYQFERLESEGSEDRGDNNKLEEKYRGLDEVDDDDKSIEGEDQPSEDISEEDDKDIFLSENPYQQVNKNNLLGIARYIKWMRHYEYFFGLDMQRGRLLLYKKQKQKKPSTYYSLIKGRFDQESDNIQDEDNIIRIKNKKGRRFKLELYSSKDPKKIKELIELCFTLKIQQANKGFYATLGRSVMSVLNHPFNVSSGIIVDMKGNSTSDEAKKKKSKLMKEKINKIKGYTALSSLFFSQSDLLKEILGSISGFILNPFNSKALSDSFSGAHFVIGLVFKPISGTIDLIGKSTEYKKDHVIHGNVFKVYKILKNKKKNNKKERKLEEERQKRETALEIHNDFMEKVYENDDEVLYLSKNNQLGITKKDIVQLSTLAKGLNLEDVDHTLKVDIQYEQQKVKMNKLLDYYIKNRKEKSEEYEEDMCEFIILQPIMDKSVRSERILKDLDDDKQSASSTGMIPNEVYFDEEIEEIGDEIGDERIGDCVNKKIPFTTNYHQADKKETFNTIMPQFLVKDSPFKSRNGYDKGFYEDDVKGNKVSPYQYRGESENLKPTTKEKFLEEGQLKIPFTTRAFLNPEKQYSDADDEMQFHSFTNQQPNDNPSMDQGQPDVDKDRNGKENNKENEQAMHLVVQNEINLKNNQEQDHSHEVKQSNNTSDGVLAKSHNEEEEKEESEDEEEEEDQGIAKAVDKNVYFTGTKQDLQKLIDTFNGVALKDEQRVSDSHANGGKQCLDKEIINTTRSVGKFIIKEIGRKIISGDFNLTTVSFPIKAMIPKSALQTSLTGTCLFPIYMGKAAQTTNLVERFKLLITATFANFPVANTFLKPLNPILGETFQASYIDGTKLYGEQVSHHPPVSYFLAQGPNKSYQYYGYYLYEAKAGWNSLTLKNKGKRSIIFADGQKINYNFGYEYYSGTFMGTMKHETLGQIDFIDPVNEIEATIITGKVKKKPSDYLQGDIKVKGKVVSSCYGSYLGFMEFDGVRYWDHRQILPMKMNILNSSLQSDHTKRTDRKYLAQASLKKAQDEKERLGLIQRNDAKLRKKVQEKKEKLLKANQKEQQKELKATQKAEQKELKANKKK